MRSRKKSISKRFDKKLNLTIVSVLVFAFFGSVIIFRTFASTDLLTISLPGAYTNNDPNFSVSGIGQSVVDDVSNKTPIKVLQLASTCSSAVTTNCNSGFNYAISGLVPSNYYEVCVNSKPVIASSKATLHIEGISVSQQNIQQGVNNVALNSYAKQCTRQFSVRYTNTLYKFNMNIPQGKWYTTTLTVTQLGTAPKIKAEDKAMWAWGVKDYTTADVDALVSFSISKNVNVIYLESQSLLINNPQKLSDMISKINNKGIEVQLLYGYHPWTLTKNHQAALDLMQRSVNFYNNSSYAKPGGVHFDVEPSSLAEWSQDKIGTANQWIDLYTKLYSIKGPLKLTADLQMAFDNVNITRNNVTKSLTEWGIDSTDATVMMAYRDSATSPSTDNIISHSNKAVNYATSTGKVAIVGVETTCNMELEKITFCEEGESAMNSELTTVVSNFRSKNGFGGVAVHSYNSYKILAP